MGNLTADVYGGRYLPSQGFSSTLYRPYLRDLEGIVSRTITNSRAAGRDYMSQGREAATAVLAVRPDLSFGQAMDAVERLRDVAA